MLCLLNNSKPLQNSGQPKLAQVISVSHEEKNDAWTNHPGLFVSLSLAKKGILAIKAAHEKTCYTTTCRFTLGTRTLFFKQAPKSMNQEKPKGLLDQLEQYTHVKRIGAVSEVLATIIPSPTLALVHEYIDKDTFPKEETDVIYNSDCKDEFFLSLPIKFTQPQIAPYAYPWLSRDTDNVRFDGFEQFFMADHLFCSNLAGQDQHGNVISLINGQLKFFKGQKIMAILYDFDTLNPYEEHHLHEARKLAQIVSLYSKPGVTKQLFYHLPHYDYILFCLYLFIHGRITLIALNDFFRVILQNKDNHIKKIKEIYAQYNIKVTVISPFENIFSPLHEAIKKELNNESSDDMHIARIILAAFKIPPIEVQPETISTDQEKDFVHGILRILQKNAFHNKRPVWTDFLRAITTDIPNSDSKVQTTTYSINNLESLFKLTNVITVAMVTTNTQDYKTCLWLPLTQKQTQTDYACLSNNKRLQGKYPAVFNVTVIDSLISYNSNTYYNGWSVATIIKKWPLIEQVASEHKLDEDNLQKTLLSEPNNTAQLTMG